jgi:thiol-disulfide isomerase/thioredoxin
MNPSSISFKRIVFSLLLLPALTGLAQKPANRPVLHRPAADFTLKTPIGEDLRLSSLQGQYVIVDFWASWCMPCRASIPHLKEVYVRYHAEGLEIVSVSIDARPEAWKRAVEQEQMPWKQALDTYTGENNFSDVSGGYGIRAIPYTLLLDKEGKVITINPEPHALDKQLKKLFGH